MERSDPSASEYRRRLRAQRAAVGLAAPTFAEVDADAVVPSSIDVAPDPDVDPGAPTPAEAVAEDVTLDEDAAASAASDAVDGDGEAVQASPRRKRGKVADKDVTGPTSEG